MKNKTLLLLYLASFPLISGCQMLTNPPLSKLAVWVVDETGRPVSNAYVSAWTYWTDGGKIRGLTNTNGFFHYNDRVYREIGYRVMKEGYYNSSGEAWWPKTRYQVPETNLVVELKRIIEPSPLLYRKVRREMPRLDRAVPFDLEVGDWVFPDGKGKVADIWVSGTNAWVSDIHYDYYAEINTSNHVDGFVPVRAAPKASHRLASELRPPHVAPLDGYTTRMDLHSGKHKEATGTKWISSGRDDWIRLFRVRSVTNDVGKVVAANVGWMEELGTGVGGIMDSNLVLVFEYYFNPDPHSRSLEPKELADRQARDIPSIE